MGRFRSRNRALAASLATVAPENGGKLLKPNVGFG